MNYYDYNKAVIRMRALNFADYEMDIIFSDWPNMAEHLKWLLAATRDEISQWIGEPDLEEETE